MKLRSLGRSGNLQLVRDESRAFPGLLIQGDTLAALAQGLEEEAPDSYALQTVNDWLTAYEEMMRKARLNLPYRR